MFVSFKRIVRSGINKFLRDRSSTGAALVVMTIVLLVVSFLFVLQGMSAFLLERLEEGVDVSAYFKETASEEDIFEVRRSLLDLEEVAEAEYVSREEALRRFIAQYEKQDSILASLDALGRNPLLAHLNVKAKDPNDYARIAEFLSGEMFSSVFASIDFYDRAPIIERLSRLISGMRAVVAGVIVALSAIAVLVAFNTIRLTIYGSKGEIEIMRLVGASNWFIRGPFLVQGAFVGLVSSFAALTLLVLAGFFLSGSLRAFTGFDVLQFLLSQFFLLFFLLLVVGVGLGFAASTIAINRYLKV